MKTAISVVMNVAPFACVLCFFTKNIIKLTVDISICKIIYIRSGILYKKYDLSNVKIFQKNSLFHPDMILRPLFGF